MNQQISNDLGIAIQVVTLIGIALSAGCGMVALLRIKELHLTMNSRLDQLLKAWGQQQRAEGVAEERERASRKDGAP